MFHRYVDEHAVTQYHEDAHYGQSNMFCKKFRLQVKGHYASTSLCVSELLLGVWFQGLQGPPYLKNKSKNYVLYIIVHPENKVVTYTDNKKLVTVH